MGPKRGPQIPLFGPFWPPSARNRPPKCHSARTGVFGGSQKGVFWGSKRGHFGVPFGTPSGQRAPYLGLFSHCRGPKGPKRGQKGVKKGSKKGSKRGPKGPYWPNRPFLGTPWLRWVLGLFGVKKGSFWGSKRGSKRGPKGGQKGVILGPPFGGYPPDSKAQMAQLWPKRGSKRGPKRGPKGVILDPLFDPLLGP